MHFILVKANIQPGSSPEIPYLVGDPSSPKRYVGVKLLPVAPAPEAMVHRASGYAPAATVVADDHLIRSEAAAGCLTILNETDAPNIAAARANLEK